MQTFAFHTFIVSAALVLLPSLALSQAPANDNFAGRMVLTGQSVSSTPVDITNATREGLEPSYTGNQTVWYTWTPPQDGIATITTAGTQYYFNILSVFNGDSYADLVPINLNEDTPASLTFPVKAGLAYQICLGYGSADTATGAAVININNAPTNITAPVVIGVPAATNDNFANAQSLGSYPVVSSFTYNEAATREGQEPSYTGNQTVWWTWTAPSDCQVTMTTDGSDFDTQLSVFNGADLSALAPVAVGNGYPASVTYPAKAGFVYYVAVGFGGGDAQIAGSPVLNVVTSARTLTSPVVVGTQANANDDFSNAQSLGRDEVVSSFGFNLIAGTETLEPAADGSHTLWWKWTAPSDGVLSISSAGTTFNHVLIPYTGTSLSTLRGSGGTGSATEPVTGTFNVSGGSELFFVIGSSDGSTGTAVLNLAFAPGLSHVSIRANAKTVHYSKSHEVVFTLDRAGDLAKKILVHYKAAISNGGDSRSVTGTKTIPAHKSSVTLTGTVSYFDAEQVGFDVTLVPATGYTVSNPSSAKAKLLEH